MTPLSPTAAATLRRFANAPADAAALAPGLVPAFRAELRDAMIRVAFRCFYPGATKCAAARQLAADLTAETPQGTRRGEFIAAILALNSGRAIGWRRLLDILDCSLDR